MSAYDGEDVIVAMVSALHRHYAENALTAAVMQLDQADQEAARKIWRHIVMRLFAVADHPAQSESASQADGRE